MSAFGTFIVGFGWKTVSGVCTAFMPVLKEGTRQAVLFLRAPVKCVYSRTVKPCGVLKVKNALLQRVRYVKVFIMYTVVTKRAGWLVEDSTINHMCFLAHDVALHCQSNLCAAGVLQLRRFQAVAFRFPRGTVPMSNRILSSIVHTCCVNCTVSFPALHIS